MLSNVWAVAVFATAPFFFFGVAFASDLENIRQDVERYFSIIHGEPSLKDHYYLNGEGGESELELELQLCVENGFDPQSETCLAFHHCRYFASEDRVSMYLVAESRLIPENIKVLPKEITVERLGGDSIPNALVHVKVEGHVYSFSRVEEENGGRVFGFLNLYQIDGESINVPEVDLMEIFNNDPCRDVLLKKQ